MFGIGKSEKIKIEKEQIKLRRKIFTGEVTALLNAEQWNCPDAKYKMQKYMINEARRLMSIKKRIPIGSWLWLDPVPQGDNRVKIVLRFKAINEPNFPKKRRK